jgi:DNA replication protein DnaC
MPQPAPELQPPAEPKLTRAEVARRRRARDVDAAIYGAGVMEEHAAAKLEEFPKVDAEIVWSPTIRIHGPIGTGKTRLAIAILREKYIGEGGTLRFALAGDVFSEIRETFRDNSPRSEREVVDELCALDLLVLDDLGREGGFRLRQSSEYVLSILHRLLSRRLGERFNKHTIITTNLTLDEIEAQYDEGIASRLSTFEEVILTGADRRRLEK